MKVNNLMEMAVEASKNAYAPYSKFKLGAALKTKNGKIFTGCNIENASYSMTICAERTAIFKAVAAGEREFSEIAIYVNSDKIFPPCGACRQVLAEFSPDILITYFNNIQQVNTSLKELLPHSFSL